MRLRSGQEATYYRANHQVVISSDFSNSRDSGVYSQ